MKSLKRFGKFIQKTFTFDNQKKTILIYIITPLVLNLIIEMAGRKSPIKGLVHMFTSPVVFLANALIIFFTLTLTLLFRRRTFSYALVSVIWLILGGVNCFLLNTRVTPFSAMDFLNIDSAFKVMDKYFNIFTYTLLILLIVGVIVGLIWLFMKSPKIVGKIHYIRYAITIILAGVIMFGFLFFANAIGSLSLKFPELSKAYLNYGFAYCFSNSVFNSGVTKPSNYSQEQISKLTEEESRKQESEETANQSETTKQSENVTTANIVNEQTTNPDTGQTDNDVNTPNIIIVQLESFFDITRCNDMNFSEDPLPNFHKYQKEYASGLLSMPVVGAGTVNSEFEILTGLNIDNFGPGEYPYKTTLLDHTCESICYNLDGLGYVSHAIHNNTGGFYGRNKVFANLGFVDFTSVEYLNLNVDKDYTPMGWAKDSCLTNLVMKALDSTDKQDFVYTISVQGHGSYPTSGEFDFPIKVTAKDGSKLDETTVAGREYYTNQIHEMDQFVNELIESVKARNEKSIVVFYGDHLPSLGFEQSELKKGDIYDTDYFIWTNDDSLKYKNENMQAYEMESKLFKELGITNGVVNRYHQENKKKMTEEEYLNGLENLQYDIFGGQMLAYGGTNPYKPTNLKMGIEDIKITDIYLQDETNAPVKATTNVKEEETKLETEETTLASERDNITKGTKEEIPTDAKGYVIIRGTNFTKFSKVFVNGEYFGDTEFIDSGTLRIYYPQIRGLDSFVVSQAHSESSILSSTNEVLYYGKSFETEESTAEK